MQHAPIIKLWGPFLDDFTDISIFMILGPGGPVDDDDDDDRHLDIPLLHAITPRKKTRREAGILT